MLALLALVPAIANATITITAGTHVLLPNTAGQTVDVLITATQGEGLNAEDAFFAINGGTGPAPFVTANPSLRVAADTNFNLNNTTNPSGAAQFAYPSPNGINPPDTGLLPARSILLNNDPDSGDAVNAPIGVGKIFARLTVSTVGVPAGSYVLALTNALGPSQIADTINGPLNPTLVDGLLVIPGVPEPSSIILGLFAVAGFGAVVIRKRRALNA